MRPQGWHRARPIVMRPLFPAWCWACREAVRVFRRARHWRRPCALHPPRRVSIYPRAALRHAGRWKGERIMASSVADVMVAVLKASGARRVHGIPGDSSMPAPGATSFPTTLCCSSTCAATPSRPGSACSRRPSGSCGPRARPPAHPRTRTSRPPAASRSPSTTRPPRTGWRPPSPPILATRPRNRPADRQRGLQQHSQCRRCALYVLGHGVHR